MSIKRVAHSIPINMWIPATEKAALDFSSALLRIFRDEGARGDRQKARLLKGDRTVASLLPSYLPPSYLLLTTLR